MGRLLLSGNGVRCPLLNPQAKAAICKPFYFNLSAQPNCHIIMLAQAFIIHSPVGDLLPFIFKLVAAGSVEFVPHYVYAVVGKLGV